MKKLAIFLITFLFPYSLLAEENLKSETISIQVEVDGLKNKDGDVVFCLWREADDGFPSCEQGKNPYKMEISSAQSPHIIFQNIPSGIYAISIFHDEEKTRLIKTNFIGMPKSGVGASGKLGMIPSFEKSKINFTQNQTIHIKMVYL